MFIMVIRYPVLQNNGGQKMGLKEDICIKDSSIQLPFLSFKFILFHMVPSCSIFSQVHRVHHSSSPHEPIFFLPHQDSVGTRKWDLFQPLIAPLSKVLLQRCGRRTESGIETPKLTSKSTWSQQTSAVYTSFPRDGWYDITFICPIHHYPLSNS